MTAQNQAAVVAVQLEKVRKKVPLLFERDDTLCTMIKERGDVEKVSNRAMRLPLKIRPGGKAGQADMDGGDLGRGSGTKYDFATVTPLFFKFAVEVTKLVEYATKTAEQAVENAAKKNVVDGMAMFKAFLDKLIQTGGDGVLATTGTNVSGSTWNTTSPMWHYGLYVGQTVSVYDTTLATKRATEQEITAIDFDNGQVTLDANPAAMVAGDKFLPSGVSGATPASLFGVKYHQSFATTGTWLGLNRATYPEIRTPRVNAASSGLTTGYVRLAANKIIKALGKQAPQERVIAYMNLEQEHAWENLGTIISQVILNELKGGQPDQLAGVPKTMGGRPITSSINADPTRIDFLALSHWGRAVIQDIDMYEVGGNTVFPIYGTSGGLAAAYIWYLIYGFQVWTDSPRSGSYIENLLKPTGYL